MTDHEKALQDARFRLSMEPRDDDEANIYRALLAYAGACDKAHGWFQAIQFACSMGDTHGAIYDRAADGLKDLAALASIKPTETNEKQDA